MESSKVKRSGQIYRLMKSARDITMRIITAAIATSTQPTTTISTNRKIYTTTPIPSASTSNRHTKITPTTLTFTRTSTRAPKVDRTTTFALGKTAKSGTPGLQPSSTFIATTTKSTPRHRAFGIQSQSQIPILSISIVYFLSP